jgi:hypothetical protein
MGERRDGYRVLEGTPEEQRPLEIPGHRWGDSIRMHLKEIRWEEKDWIDLTQNRDKWLAVVKTLLSIWVP